VSPTAFRTGGYSAEMIAGSTANHHAGMKWLGGLYPTGNAGTTFSFSLPGLVEQVQCFLFYNTAAQTIEAELIYDEPSGQLFIIDKFAGPTAIGAVTLPARSANTFSTVKMVLDLVNKKYIRVRFNAQEFDVSAYTIPYSAGAYPNQLQFYIFVVGRAANNDRMYLDNVILTFAEPD